MEFIKSSGQINMDGEFGKLLYEISMDPKILNIIEIGTWNGQGSTVCIMNAILNKSNTKLYSIEANYDMFSLAQNFWKEYKVNNKLILLNGTLHNKIADLNELNLVYNNNIPYYQEHYLPERNLFENENSYNPEK